MDLVYQSLSCEFSNHELITSDSIYPKHLDNTNLCEAVARPLGVKPMTAACPRGSWYPLLGALFNHPYRLSHYLKQPSHHFLILDVCAWPIYGTLCSHCFVYFSNNIYRHLTLYLTYIVFHRSPPGECKLHEGKNFVLLLADSPKSFWGPDPWKCSINVFK